MISIDVEKDGANYFLQCISQSGIYVCCRNTVFMSEWLYLPTAKCFSIGGAVRRMSERKARAFKPALEYLSDLLQPYVIAKELDPHGNYYGLYRHIYEKLFVGYNTVRIAKLNQQNVLDCVKRVMEE
jgi:hypothetical protein